MRTVGVEEEFLLVDEAQRKVRPLAGRLFASLDAPGTDQVASAEFKDEQAEIASAPWENMSGLRDDLVVRRRRAADAAEQVGARLAAVGTCPTPVTPTGSSDPRYQRITAEYGLLARTHLTCGTHVHVSIDSREEGIEVLNRIRPWLSVLTALSANSPFWNDEDSGYASYRTIMCSRWPTAGPVEMFADPADYDRRVRTLIATEVIADAGMVYFDARLSSRFPTVEVRVADACSDVDNSVLAAALSRALVETAARDARDGVPPISTDVTMLRGAAWRAARSGLSGDLIDVRAGRAVAAWSLVDALFDHVDRSLVEHGDAGRTERLLNGLRATGTGADRQRAIHARRGRTQDVLDDVVERTGKG